MFLRIKFVLFIIKILKSIVKALVVSSLQWLANIEDDQHTTDLQAVLSLYLA